MSLYVCLTCHILHKGINTVDAHSLTLIPHLGLSSFIHGKIEWTIVSLFFTSSFQKCLEQFYRASLSTCSKHLGLNDSSFLAKSTLASLGGFFLLSHEFNTTVVGIGGKIFNVHVVVLLAAPQTWSVSWSVSVTVENGFQALLWTTATLRLER